MVREFAFDWNSIYFHVKSRFFLSFHEQEELDKAQVQRKCRFYIQSSVIYVCRDNRQRALIRECGAESAVKGWGGVCLALNIKLLHWH